MQKGNQTSLLRPSGTFDLTGDRSPSATNGTETRGNTEDRGGRSGKPVTGTRRTLGRATPAIKIPVNRDNFPIRPLAAKTKVGMMSRNQKSSAGASITVTFAQEASAGPRGARIRTGSYFAIVCMTLPRSRLIFLPVVLSHSRCTAQAVQQPACGPHSAEIRTGREAGSTKVL